MTMTNLITSLNARTGEPLAEIPASTSAEMDRACQAAASALDDWQASSAEQRTALLRGLADALEGERASLVAQADAETALGPVRLNGELDRTSFQLRRFADLVAQNQAFAITDDPAIGGGPPAGHPAMQRWQVPLGPVAMFAASNFPFAFSVLGGDTASALAAGCSVVVKAHSGHLLTSRMVFDLTQTVLLKQGLPAGLVGMVQDLGHEVGVRLIRHPAIAAGAFTGSTRGGAALAAQAAARAVPIPFFGELGAINPVVAWPSCLSRDGQALAQQLAASITQGSGQFCTSPGVVLLCDATPTLGDARATNDQFVDQLAAALSAQTTHPMLTKGIRQALDAGVRRWVEGGASLLLSVGTEAAPQAVLAQVSASDFIAEPMWRDEVFGPACLVVRAADVDEGLRALRAVGGSLTATLWGLDEDSDAAHAWVRAAMSVAGRVLFAGVPTGVAVSRGQQHGGPWPSCTRPESTSVGDAALQRFLRPVCLQDPPNWVMARAGRPF
jgi:NADP-dependent aldehyde dehydrogenase